MKKLLLFLSSFIWVLALCTHELLAQQGWYWQNPLPQGNSLYGVHAVDTSIVIAVGASGTILRTTDGGTTWTPQSSGTIWPLNGVFFTDANTGTAVGGEAVEPATILRTTDGGANWFPQSVPSEAIWELYDVYFTDANTGTAG